LKDVAGFWTALRKATERGLAPDAALVALTTAPAELFGLGDRFGTIAAGKSGSLVVADGDLFRDTKAKIVETWVDGKRYPGPPPPIADLRGRWEFQLPKTATEREALAIVLEGTAEKLTGKLIRGKKETPLKNPAIDGAQWNASFKGDAVDWKGEAQVSAAVLVGSGDHVRLDGMLLTGDGRPYAFQAKRVKEQPKSTEDSPAEKKDDAKKSATEEKKSPPPADAKKVIDDGQDKPPVKVPDPEQGSPAKKPEAKPAADAKATDAKSTDKTPTDKKTDAKTVADKKEPEKPKRALFAVNYPLGEFGLERAPAQHKVVAFTNAVVWTCSEDGKLEGATVLIEAGKIKAVGKNVPVPSGAMIVDCRGKHLTPGIIDCHSHIATDGGVNEATQSVTAEVRIGDFIDPHDINIYRQLGGGVTAANILHGSANTIGGQNQVIKFRWGALPEEMKFAAAPPGIKFALGENVKQSNWGPGFSSRYPQTRMGVEQLLRDSFRAADDYRRRWTDYRRTKRGTPPRVDLEMEALVEILEGKRLIHCHSYRQDEILTFLRVCEEFRVRVATMQHILEGYKVADVMAKHGVGGSSFSDWWAYKFEVWDAIPYNGALMHEQGVVVSFNSDDAELARRLNSEAGKAVKYGGVNELEALKFVTLNPAKQLGIDRWVGSIEPGKDADLALWSTSPLSSYTRCEQTWIDGRKYFDRAQDVKQRQDLTARRAALVQRILGSGETSGSDDDKKNPMWDREDIYCGCRSPHIRFGVQQDGARKDGE
jgi:N-acetylglucosamine-6-phosphate deacetylase